jgi:hypothetical protein
MPAAAALLITPDDLAELRRWARSAQPVTASLGCGDVAPDELVRASFEFLLEREPATSILREISLNIISQYFPGYPAKIGARLGGSNPGAPR